MLQGSGPGTMHGRTGGGFDGLQIDTPGSAQSGEEYGEEPIYFLGNFVPDRL